MSVKIVPFLMGYLSFALYLRGAQYVSTFPFALGSITFYLHSRSNEVEQR
jgi:hypothetical protein